MPTSSISPQAELPSGSLQTSPVLVNDNATAEVPPALEYSLEDPCESLEIPETQLSLCNEADNEEQANIGSAHYAADQITPEGSEDTDETALAETHIDEQAVGPVESMDSCGPTLGPESPPVSEVVPDEGDSDGSTASAETNTRRSEPISIDNDRNRIPSYASRLESTGMNRSEITDSDLTLYRLTADDVWFLSATVGSAQSLEALCNSVEAWQLLARIRLTEKPTIIQIMPFATGSWVVIAKITKGNDIEPLSLEVNSRPQGGRTVSALPRRKRQRQSRRSIAPGGGGSENMRLRTEAPQQELARIDNEECWSLSDDYEEMERRPTKRGRWSEDEDLRLNTLVENGVPWAQIFTEFPTRSEPAVRSRWNCVLKQL